MLHTQIQAVRPIWNLAAFFICIQNAYKREINPLRFYTMLLRKKFQLLPHLQSMRNNKKDPSPYVGAVLFKPDGTFDKAHRGECREENHAEYTLLDKKSRDKVITDSILFATLEPCAKGVVMLPKLFVLNEL